MPKAASPTAKPKGSLLASRQARLNEKKESAAMPPAARASDDAPASGPMDDAELDAYIENLQRARSVPESEPKPTSTDAQPNVISGQSPNVVNEDEEFV